MRIRKNLKLLNLSPYPTDAIDETQTAAAAAAKTKPIICQLNQNPWDVFPLSSPDSSPSYPQLEEDAFNPYRDIKIGGSTTDVKQSQGQQGFGFGGWTNRTLAVNARDAAPNSLMDLDDTSCYDDVKKRKVNENDVCGSSRNVEMYDEAKKDDEDVVADAHGKCKRKIKISEKAPPLMRSMSSGDSSNGVAKRRARGPSKKVPTGPYDFYYYEGFGPRWGKKRGEEGNRDCGNNKEKSASEENNGDIRETDEPKTERYVDDDYEEDSGRKKARKPMKARSLKSLM